MSQLSHCQSCQETPEEQDRVKVASRSQVKTSNNLACTLHRESLSVFPEKSERRRRSRSFVIGRLTIIRLSIGGKFVISLAGKDFNF